MEALSPAAGSLDVSSTQPVVTVFWHPGCPYCSSLRRGLRRAAVEAEEINIWEHPDAAARVRSLAHGNETVPTVVVGDLSFVNPTAREIIAVLHGEDPAPAHRSRMFRLALRWATVGVVIVASFVVDALGHHGVSWGLDGVAVALYGLLRMVQR